MWLRRKPKSAGERGHLHRATARFPARRASLPRRRHRSPRVVTAAHRRLTPRGSAPTPSWTAPWRRTRFAWASPWIWAPTFRFFHPSRCFFVSPRASRRRKPMRGERCAANDERWRRPGRDAHLPGNLITVADVLASSQLRTSHVLWLEDDIFGFR